MERRQELKKGIFVFLTLAFTLAVVLPALAEDPAAIAAQNEKAETKTLRKEIVKLKYVRAQDIQNLLYAYASRDGHIQFNPNMPTVLSVSDTPENVEKILAAVREIDVKPADVLYTVQLVLGSETDAQTDA
jgi:type II secretory pathway component GspD/PulD (secretin)